MWSKCLFQSGCEREGFLNEKGSRGPLGLVVLPSLPGVLAAAVLLLESSKWVSASEAGLCYRQLGDRCHSHCRPLNSSLYS